MSRRCFFGVDGLDHDYPPGNGLRNSNLGQWGYRSRQDRPSRAISGSRGFFVVTPVFMWLVMNHLR